eukprot:1416752-Pyramimonas_sp.AAC.1
MLVVCYPAYHCAKFFYEEPPSSGDRMLWWGGETRVQCPCRALLTCAPLKSLVLPRFFRGRCVSAAAPAERRYIPIEGLRVVLRRGAASGPTAGYTPTEGLRLIFALAGDCVHVAVCVQHGVVVEPAAGGPAGGMAEQPRHPRQAERGGAHDAGAGRGGAHALRA